MSFLINTAMFAVATHYLITTILLAIGSALVLVWAIMPHKKPKPHRPPISDLTATFCLCLASAFLCVAIWATHALFTQ